MITIKKAKPENQMTKKLTQVGKTYLPSDDAAEVWQRVQGNGHSDGFVRLSDGLYVKFEAVDDDIVFTQVQVTATYE